MGRPKKAVEAEGQEEVQAGADEAEAGDEVEVEEKVEKAKPVEAVHINTIGKFSLYQVGDTFVVKNSVGQLIGNPKSQEEGMSLLTGFARSNK